MKTRVPAAVPFGIAFVAGAFSSRESDLGESFRSDLDLGRVELSSGAAARPLASASTTYVSLW